MAKKIKVVSFDAMAFQRELEAASGCGSAMIGQKPQVAYFNSYFGTIKPATLVVEYGYVDRDYLEDYSAYYVRSFSGYPRFCTRLLFFENTFNEDDFLALVRGETSRITPKGLEDSFLGFMVLKPLPFTVVGRTCLKTYDNNGERSYPIKRQYQVHLCGISLSVESLAFQEQDSVAAACATSALWSAFHATGCRFQHAIPSPIEITKAATSSGVKRGRTFPNIDGLTLEEMAQAVRNMGLEPHTFAANDEGTFRSAVYSYVAAGIPVILAMGLWEMGEAAPVRFGGHAIAVTGFGINGVSPAPPQGMLNAANKIDRIYVHDDGIGPFARMELDGQAIAFGGDSLFSMSTSWKGPSGTTGSVRAAPEYIMVPVYHKIRIPMLRIHAEITEFDQILDGLRTHGLLPSIGSRVEWDIQLATGNEIKSEIFSSSGLLPDDRERILILSLPKYVGHVKANVGKNTALQLIFDLTSIDQGSLLLAVISHDVNIYSELRAIAMNPVIKTMLGCMRAWNIFDWFANN